MGFFICNFFYYGIIFVKYEIIFRFLLFMLNVYKGYVEYEDFVIFEKKKIYKFLLVKFCNKKYICSLFLNNIIFIKC